MRLAVGAAVDVPWLGFSSPSPCWRSGRRWAWLEPKLSRPNRQTGAHRRSPSAPWSPEPARRSSVTRSRWWEAAWYVQLLRYREEEEEEEEEGCTTHRLIAYCFLSLLHPEVALHSSFFLLLLNIISNFTLLSLINNWTWSLTLNFQPCHLSLSSVHLTSPFTHIPLPRLMPLNLLISPLIPSSSLPWFHVSLYPCIPPFTHPHTQTLSLLPPRCGSLFPPRVLCCFLSQCLVRRTSIRWPW